MLLPTVLVAVGCETAGPDTGGETHFLRVCSPDTNSCGTGLECICGICTQRCEARSSCSDLADAECVPLSYLWSSDEDPLCASPSEKVCELSCQTDARCADISPHHRCEGGSCRLAASASESGGGADDSSADGSPACAASHLDANEVVVLGDSFLAASHQITAYLEAHARLAGALSEGYRYRDYSLITENTFVVMGEGISGQFEGAIAEAPARVVIMNGGGGDVLLGVCDPPLDQCPAIVDSVDVFEGLLTRMSENGVEDVVFVGYPDPVPETIKEKMDVLRPLLVAACESSPVPCHWVDLRESFVGHYDDYVEPGGLNPTSAGSEAAAAAIWDTMQRECIAQ